MVVFNYIYHKNQPNVGKYTIPMDPSWVILVAKSPPFRSVSGFFGWTNSGRLSWALKGPMASSDEPMSFLRCAVLIYSIDWKKVPKLRCSRKKVI